MFQNVRSTIQPHAQLSEQIALVPPKKEMATVIEQKNDHVGALPTEIHLMFKRLSEFAGKGLGSHSPLTPHSGCCEGHDHKFESKFTDENKSQLWTPGESLENFSAELKRIADSTGKLLAKSRQVLDGSPQEFQVQLRKEHDKSSTGHLEQLQDYVRVLIKRQAQKSDSPEPSLSYHDLQVLVREVFSEGIAKLAKYPTDKNVQNHVANLLETMNRCFGEEIQKTSLKGIWPEGGGQPAGAEMIVENMVGFLTQAKNSPESPEDAYRSGALLILRTLKPQAKPVRISDSHFDHHYHLDPYFKGSGKSTRTDMHWNAAQMRSLNLQGSDSMDIPHFLTVNGEAGAQNLNNVPIPYYADKGSETRFYSSDASHIQAYNKLSVEDRQFFQLCATGIPVAAEKLEAVKQLAQKFAYNVALQQIEDNVHHVSVNFGEITGYKPAVPQPMLNQGRSEKSDIEAKNLFINGTADVETAIFVAASEGIAKAFLEKKKTADEVKNYQTQVRIVYHADALPNEAAVQASTNLRPPPEQDKLYEITSINDLVQAAAKVKTALATEKKSWNDKAKAIDHEVEGADKELCKMLNALNTRHHLQMAHLMGASIAEHNYTNAERVTEIDKAIREIDPEILSPQRGKENEITLTVDTSWLTASARSINHGMQQHYDKCDNLNVNALGELCRGFDDYANKAFMFMGQGERFFAMHDKSGLESTMDMALVRAAQKKSVQAAHTTLGKIHQLVQTPEVLEALVRHCFGTKGAGDCEAGNYLGLFLKYGKVDHFPFVFGTDNLTPGNTHSGPEKMLLYTSQAATLEIQLQAIATYSGKSDVITDDIKDSAAKALRCFQLGTAEQIAFRKNSSRIVAEGIHDGTPDQPAATQESGHAVDMINSRWDPLTATSILRGKSTSLSMGEAKVDGQS